MFGRKVTVEELERGGWSIGFSQRKGFRGVLGFLREQLEVMMGRV